MSAPKPGAAPSELRELVSSLRPHFVRAMWFSFFASVLGLASSWYMMEVYDRVVGSRSMVTLGMLTIMVLVAYVVLEVVEWGRAEVLRGASVEMDQKLSSRVFRAVFDANLIRHPGGNAQAFHDLRTIRKFLCSPALLAMMEAPMSLIFLVLLFAISPWVGWLAIAGAIVQVLLTWATETSTRDPLMEANRTAIQARQYAEAPLRQAEVVESMGMLRSIHAQWFELQRKMISLQALASDRAGVLSALSRSFQQLMSSALMGVSAWLLLKNELNGGAGMLIITSILGGRMLAPLVQMISQWKTVVNMRSAWMRLNALLTDIPAQQLNMPLPAPQGALKVESLTAAAPGTQSQILRGISFELGRGEVLAVVGPSASGKTSLARLLVGVWPTMAGKVRLDGVDIFSWNKTELGPHIGYLPQGVELFEGTVAENIARFGPVDMEQVEAAARLVGMHEAILQLPDGYETQIGGNGGVMSGGQRQRVALARALYGNPAFVVLDEPNSNLDEIGDMALAQAVASMKARGTTFVLMTHRTSILAVADKMLIIRDGQMQQFGSRDEVLQALKGGGKRPAAAKTATAPVRPKASQQASAVVQTVSVPQRPAPGALPSAGRP